MNDDFLFLCMLSNLCLNVSWFEFYIAVGYFYFYKYSWTLSWDTVYFLGNSLILLVLAFLIFWGGPEQTQSRTVSCSELRCFWVLCLMLLEFRVISFFFFWWKQALFFLLCVCLALFPSILLDGSFLGLVWFPLTHALISALLNSRGGSFADLWGSLCAPLSLAYSLVISSHTILSRFSFLSQLKGVWLYFQSFFMTWKLS